MSHLTFENPNHHRDCISNSPCAAFTEDHSWHPCWALSPLPPYLACLPLAPSSSTFTSAVPNYHHFPKAFYISSLPHLSLTTISLNLFCNLRSRQETFLQNFNPYSTEIVSLAPTLICFFSACCFAYCPMNDADEKTGLGGVKSLAQCCTGTKGRVKTHSSSFQF